MASEKDPNNQNTKLGYAITVFGKKYNKYVKPYNEIVDARNEELEEAKTMLASEDDKGNLLKLIEKDDKGVVVYTEYKYTRENQALLNKKISIINKKANSKIEELLVKEIKIAPYYTTSIPASLTVIELEYFTGIVIAPIEVKANGSLKQLQD